LRKALTDRMHHDDAARAAVEACEKGDAETFRVNIKIARQNVDDADTKRYYDTFAGECEKKFASKPADDLAEAATPPEQAKVEPDDEKTSLLKSLPAECRKDFSRLLAGGKRRDGAAATSAYAALHENDVCNPYLSLLARGASARLPERIMSDRSRRALQRAMSGDPNQLADSVGDRDYDAAYNAGEVLDFGLALLGAYSGAMGTRGLAASVRSPAASVRPASRGIATTFRPAPPSSQSTITGIGRN
jgi:hypothetical protein